MQDIFGALEDTAARQPGSIALAARAGYMSYDDFLGNVASAAAAAARNKIQPGQLVVVATSRQDARLILALALMRRGCRVGYSRDVRTYEASGVTIDAIVSDAAIPAAKHRVVIVGRDWFMGKAASTTTSPPPATGYSLIFASSGSTGSPKLIEFDQSALQLRISKTISDAYLQDRPRFLSAFGDSTASTFQDQLIALINGGMIVRSDARSATDVLAALQLFLPSYVLIAPSALAEVLRAANEPRTRIDKVRWLRLAGAQCSPALRQAALDHIAENLVMSYGATEIGRVAWGVSSDASLTHRSVGRIVDGVDVATFDSDGRMLPPGSEGEIRVNVQEGTAGQYLGSDSLRQQVFKGGWFATGDIGRVDDHRNLIILGRSSDVINIGGSKVSPDALEERLLAFSQIRDAGVSGVEVPEGFERICAAIVTNAKLTVDDVNAHLRRQRVPWAVHKVIIVAAVPKTESGKINRAALRRLCAE